MGKRAEVLAGRVEAGAELLAQFAEGLTDAEWNARVRDGRTVGVIVHHVASMYPVEVEVARAIAAGNAVEAVTWEDVAGINAKHAVDHAKVNKATAIGLLRTNSKEAAAAVREFSDAELDTAAGFLPQLRGPDDGTVRGRGSCPAARLAPSRADQAGARPVAVEAVPSLRGMTNEARMTAGAFVFLPIWPVLRASLMHRQGAKALDGQVGRLILRPELGTQRSRVPNCCKSISYTKHQEAGDGDCDEGKAGAQASAARGPGGDPAVR
jgi:hypothetical protein